MLFKMQILTALVLTTLTFPAWAQDQYSETTLPEEYSCTLILPGKKAEHLEGIQLNKVPGDDPFYDHKIKRGDFEISLQVETERDYMAILVVNSKTRAIFGGGGLEGRVANAMFIDLKTNQHTNITCSKHDR